MAEDNPPSAHLPVPAHAEPPPERPDRAKACRAKAYRAKPYRERHDGWTAARQDAFIASLTRTRCVRDACRVAGISTTSAYRHRRRSAAFDARWALALRRSETTIGEVAWQRAVEGVEEDVWYHGKVVGQRTRYANDVLRLLIQHDTNGAGRDAAGRFAARDGGVDAGAAEVEAEVEAGGDVGARTQALPAPEDEGPIPRPKGPITRDNLAAKFDAIAARARAYGQRHINIKTGAGLTDEVLAAVDRFRARGRVVLPQEFQWLDPAQYDAQEADYCAGLKDRAEEPPRHRDP